MGSHDCLEPVREQTLFIQTKYRSSGTSSNFTVTIPPGLLQADATETMSVTLIDFVCKNNVPAFQLYNNKWLVELVSTGAQQLIQVPLGFYSAYQFLQFMQGQLPGWIITYDQITNRFTWVTPGPVYAFIFTGSALQNSACSFLGFAQSDIVQGTTFTSTLPADMGGEEVLFLHSSMPQLREANVDNTGGKFTSSSIIAKIPVAAVPYGVITYQDLGGTFEALLSVSSFGEIRFWITQEDGIQVPIPTDYSFTLRVRYLKKSTGAEQQILLKEIAELSRLKMLLAHPAA